TLVAGAEFEPTTFAGLIRSEPEAFFIALKRKKPNEINYLA
ncbi:MAG: hypothetical protein ACJAWL_001801, partial [Motiliproteus sp.]